MDEKRFAILIGINDYKETPLNYCVEDANKVEEILIKKARYESQNIYKIISDSDKPVRNITGLYLDKLREIKYRFRADKDSILFYFAGHGKHYEESSMIKFHDSFYTILDISKDIVELKPKIQIYIIDACESGGKVLSRNENKSQFDNGILNQHIETCSGVFFLYACQSNEHAYESSDDAHGKMTLNFLKALSDNALYDADGILTPGRIQEFVAKNTAEQSNFNQIPVIENRITGYYPFAFLNEKSKLVIKYNDMNKPLHPVYTQENRLDFQKFVFDHMENYLKKVEEIVDKNYSLDDYTTLEDTSISNKTRLIEEMVESSEELNLYSINKIFIRENKINPSKYLSQLLPIFSALGNRYDKLPEYITEYKVDFSNIYINSFFKIFRSIKINNVSFCIFFYVYQTRWGAVLAIMTFLLDWDGEKDSLIKHLEKRFYPFLINEKSKEEILDLKIDLVEEIESKIKTWNQEREDEITSFLQSTSNFKNEN